MKNSVEYTDRKRFEFSIIQCFAEWREISYNEKRKRQGVIVTEDILSLHLFTQKRKDIDYTNRKHFLSSFLSQIQKATKQREAGGLRGMQSPLPKVINYH